MKPTASLISLLATGAIAAIGDSGHIPSRQTTNGCDGPVVLDAKSNIFLNYTLHANSIWRSKVLAAVEATTDAELKKRGLKAGEQGTFVWIENSGQISRIQEAVKDVPCNHVLGLVIAGLPYKECPSIGTPPASDPWSYEDLFLKPIVELIKAYSNVPFVIIVEPGVLGTVVQNPQKMCQHVRRSWRQNVPLALKSLDLPNVVTYLDGAHGGWLGWQDTQKPGAKEIADTWQAAGKLTQFRGLAVNVASYNQWDMSPGEMFEGENTCYDIENPARNEQKYLAILRRRIIERNITMPLYCITDTSRNGVAGTRRFWEDWCNIHPAGYGWTPTANTGDMNLDAYVWVKWGGESDGTSDPTSRTYSSFCGRDDAFKPMPEKGEWSQAYFEMLLREWRLKPSVQGGWKKKRSPVERNRTARRCG